MRKLLALLLWCVGSAAYAQSNPNFSGNEMLPHCKQVVIDASKGNAIMNGICIGQITAIMDLQKLLLDDAKFCQPDGVTRAQATRVVIRFLENSPQILHRDFDILALVALKATWPCKK